MKRNSQRGSPFRPGGCFAEFGVANAEGNHTTEGSGAEGLDLPCALTCLEPDMVLSKENTIWNHIPLINNDFPPYSIPNPKTIL